MPPPITLTSPLGSDLLFESMTASAGLSTLGEMRLGLVSARPDLKAEDLLGKPVTVTVQLRDGAKRHFNGYVTRFGLGVHRGRYFGYEATVHAWPWFLTRTADCRIFQAMTVPDIVKKVFEDHGVADFQLKLFRSYRTWTYCVQYRESDFNFVSRLLEHEGIYWYFEHTDGKHKLVLVDSHSAHDKGAICDSLPYIEEGAETSPDTECVSGWHSSREVRAGKTALTSYDFERPSTDLATKAATDRGHALGDYELFDWQGDYVQAADGSQWAEDRLDEQQTSYQVLQGSANAHGIEVGRLLTLTRHPRADQNAQYLVTGLQVSASVDGYEAGNAAGAYRCEFSAMPAAQQFRPARRTPKPFVQGPQTALVVGPGGEEIFTDKYGRIKLQFHWDRYGKKDENSSCWVRVSHPWAGKNFGVVDIPRIGQEVVVDFLEGDPDQPLVTGRVYNAEQMPPWDLPANATQSGILTRSSKGGAYGNANAIRFEDKAGGEQLWIHAEKNQDIEVEKDETHWVGQDRKKTIDRDETTHVKRDRTETVDHDETITVHNNRTETVDQEEKITIHGGRTEVVDKEEKITIHGGRTEQVDHDEKITIDGGRTEIVGKEENITIHGGRTEKVDHDENITIGGGRTESVKNDEKITINGGRTEQVAHDEKVSIGGGRTTSVKNDEGVTIGGGRTVSVKNDDGLTVTGGRSVSVKQADSLDVGATLSVTAKDSITMKVGSASIEMHSNGTITINGKDVTVDGSGKISVKASSDITMKGSKILHN
jgi:type VI secretion system secreted protein VgrG